MDLLLGHCDHIVDIDGIHDAIFLLVIKQRQIARSSQAESELLLREGVLFDSLSLAINLTFLTLLVCQCERQRTPFAWLDKLVCELRNLDRLGDVGH